MTLRIINDDTTVHILHTDGVPCPHGPIGAPLKKGDKLTKDGMEFEVKSPTKQRALVTNRHGITLNITRKDVLKMEVVK